MNSFSSISVVMPAYRAEGVIAEAVTRVRDVLRATGRPHEIVVVVDGAVDATAERVNDLNFDYVSVIVNPVNRGKGHALRTGFAACSSNYVGFIDADLDLHPEGLALAADILDHAPDVDVVVASKVHRDSQVSYPLARRIQSRVFSLLVRVLFGLPVRDTQTGLKVFRADVIHTALPECRCDGFAIDLELLSLSHRQGARMTEIPVDLDFQFESTVRLSSAASVLADTLRVWTSHLRDRR